MSNAIMLCEDQADDTTCSVCFAEFLDPNDLELHIQQVHPSGKLIGCQFCEKTLSDAETYMLHIRDAHLLDFKSCSVCCRIFTHWTQMRRHESVHPRSMLKGTFACSQCSQYFLYKSELMQHEVDNHYKTSEGAFLNKYFSLLSSVINIKADVFLKSTENLEQKHCIYTCFACKHQNSNLEAYVTHLRKKNCRSLACDQCGKVYKKKAGLILHLSKLDCNTIRGKLQKKITHKQCKICKKYLDQKSMKDHGCTPSLKCSLCNKVFKTMYELSEHQSKAHPLAIALTVCQFCRKECVGTISLEKHVQRSHEHEFHLYKYTCTYCDTTFKHPQRLFAHYFLKHKDLEPYLCKICDKKFRIRKAFTLHIKLQHKSEGFVEFDEQLHVFFTDKKSEKPFQPVSKFIKEKPKDDDSPKNRKESETDKSQELQLANMESDVYHTETEGNQDAKEPVRVSKRKKPNEVMELSDYDSDNEPLVLMKKKAKLMSQLRKKPLQWRKKSKKSSKRQFTCEICKKYCYTFQNYQNHVSMHFKDESKKCIKCSLAFKSKAGLERHLTEEHSSSRLTDTLKNILERKKKGGQKQEISVKTKFLNTVKKVQMEKDDVTATLRPVNKELSLQKFIEEFTPEEVKKVQVNDSITVTKVTNPVEREPIIKMTKFKPAPEVHESLIKLAMPVKFKKCNEIHSITVKKVQRAATTSSIKVYNTYDGDQFQDDDYNYEDNKDSNIPEVEQEVTLEGTEEAPKKNPATHKIVIPKLPKELKSIRIAHLLPEAPYYKIVKMDDIMKQQQEIPVKKADVKAYPKEVRLSDGTKLVHVNPLAHLLGDTPVEQIVKTSKYYKPNTKNFEEVLANALKKLDNPSKRVRRKGEIIVRQEIKLPEKSDNVEGATETLNESEKTIELINDSEKGIELINDSEKGIELINDSDKRIEFINDSEKGTESNDAIGNAEDILNDKESTQVFNETIDSVENEEM